MEYQGKLLWFEGKPQIHRKDLLVEYLSKFPDDSWFELTVVPIGEVNAHNQRKLYFKWRDILADNWGWTSEEMHAYLKETYNSGRSTKGMDTREWSKFMTQILAFAGAENITLPTGEDA